MLLCNWRLLLLGHRRCLVAAACALLLSLYAQALAGLRTATGDADADASVAAASAAPARLQLLLAVWRALLPLLPVAVAGRMQEQTSEVLQVASSALRLRLCALSVR